MKFWTSQAFVNQLWRRLILILMITQLIFISCFFILSSKQVGTRLGENLCVLVRIVDVIYSQAADPVLTSQVVDILQKNIYFKLIPGRIDNATNKLPLNPVLLVAAKTTEQCWQGKLSILYQADPVPFLWAQKNEPPLFALGFPFLGYKFLLSMILLVLVIFLVLRFSCPGGLPNALACPYLNSLKMLCKWGVIKKLNSLRQKREVALRLLCLLRRLMVCVKISIP